MELVSVIMSVYNGEGYLKEAMDSILNQTYKNIEFLIINDGSCDNSLEIIKSYKDERIKILDNIENKGLIYSLNRGIKEAKGKYVLRMDADDISFLNRIEEQVKFMEENSDLAISGTDALYFGKNIKSYIRQMPKGAENINSYSLVLTPFIHPSIIVKTDIVKRYMYDGKFKGTEDFELWVRILKEYKGDNLSKVLLKYRILNNSITRTEEKKIKERFQLLSSIYKKSLDNLGDFSEEEAKQLTLINNRSFLKKNLESQEFKSYNFENLLDKVLKELNSNNNYNYSFALELLSKRYLIMLIDKRKIKINNFLFLGIKRIISDTYLRIIHNQRR